MRLKELRKAKGITQKDVAIAIGETEVNYNRYETEKVNIDIKKLIKLADFYGVSLDYLCEHQYNNQIGYVPDEKRDIVHKLLKLEDSKLEKVEGYITALLDN